MKLFATLHELSGFSGVLFDSPDCTGTQYVFSSQDELPNLTNSVGGADAPDGSLLVGDGTPIDVHIYSSLSPGSQECSNRDFGEIMVEAPIVVVPTGEYTPPFTIKIQ